MEANTETHSEVVAIKHVNKKQRTDSDERSFRVVINSNTDAYTSVHKRLTKMYIEQYSHDSSFTELELGSVTTYEKPEIIYRLPEDRSITVEYEGETITCCRRKISKDHGTAHDVMYLYEIAISSRSKVTIDTFVLDACKEKEILKIYLYNPEQSYWTSYGQVQKRDIESLALDKKIVDELFHDIDTFIQAENEYDMYGHPYKRNYLLHGKPGTGKTSLVNVIANKLKRNIYIICFDPALTDSGLMNAFHNIKDPHAILLLEDIDCIFQDRNTNINKSNVSHSALYNVLDGVSRVKGLITIVSTNYVDKLDSALVRPGRIDMKIKFDTITDEQVKMLLALYKTQLSKKNYKEVCSICRANELVPSSLSGFLFRTRGRVYDEDMTSENSFVNLFKRYLEEMVPKLKSDFTNMYM